MKSKSVSLLSGGMNLDKDPRLIDPNTEYTYANNFRNNNTADGSEGSGGNIKGNTLIEFTQPEGINTVIGSVSYEQKNATIYFVHNTIGEHHIRMLKDSKIYVLVKGEFLNFDSSKYISAKINGDELVFTDNYNEPRILNLERLWNYYLYLYSTYNYTEIPVPYKADSLIMDVTEYGFDTIDDLIASSYLISPVFELEGSYDIKCIFYNGKAYYVFLGLNGIESLEIGDIKDSYRDITADTIKFIAEPPQLKPTVQYLTDVNSNFNFLNGNQYRFTYMYEYLDGRKSVWSPHTFVSSSYTEKQGGILIDVNNNNVISIGIFVGRRDIKKVHLGVIKNDSVNIMIFDTINIYDKNLNINVNPNHTDINFNNDIIIYGLEEVISGTTYIRGGFLDNNIYKTESSIDSTQLYHYVPQKAKNVEISNNRVVFTDCTTGMTDVTTDVILDVVDRPSLVFASGLVPESGSYTVDRTESLFSGWNPISWEGNVTNVDYCNFTKEIRGATLSFKIEFKLNGNLYTKIFSFYHNTSQNTNQFMRDACKVVDSYLSSRVKVNLGFTIDNTDRENINSTVYNTALEHISDVNISTPEGNLVDKFFFQLKDSWYSDDPSYSDYSFAYLRDGYIRKSTPTPFIGMIHKFFQFQIEIKDWSYTKGVTTSGLTSLKSNSKYIGGIKYLNKNYEETGFKKCGEVFTGEIKDSTYPDFYYKELKMTINHKAPSDATKYIVCLSRNLGISNWVQTINLHSIVNNIDTLDIKIDSAIVKTYERNNNFNVQTWVFEKGDRVRDIGRISSTDFIYDNTFDVEIIKFDVSTGKITIPSAVSTGDTINTKQDLVVIGYMLEIYRPRVGVNDTDDVYFEVSDMLPIINGFHKGGRVNQDDSNPCELYVNYGDTYIVNRGLYDGTSAWTYVIAEHYNQTDYILSKMKIFGRPAVIVDNMKRKRYTNLIRFGGNKNYGTDYNQIARFTGEDYEYLPEQFGEIAGGVSSGNTLTIIQASKLSTYYVEKSVLYQADGTKLYVVSDKVLNNKNESVFDYGSINPESIVRVNNYIYFFDALNGMFIRNADNGSYPISDYGINRFSKLLGKAVIDLGVKVYGGYDEFNKEIVWSFNYQGEDNIFGYGISFIEGGNQWKSFQDYYKLVDDSKQFVSLLSSNVNKLVSFVEGEVYVHDSNVLYNYLYGRAVTTEIEVISNSDPLENKVFDSIVIESDSEWKSNNMGDVEVDYGLMKSMIPKVRKQEENYYADFGRDMTTQGSGTAIEKYVRGRFLRGKFMKVRLTNAATNKIKIFSVIINSTISERT